MQPLIFLLLLLASQAGADGTDVTNNLFSDLGPLLALFGDTFAQQFLRESFTWLDHIIFAMAPLGIITAIIGAIRVGGPPFLRAVIGRARENRASAELDFMSSTSHEVSELWNGDGIVRTMGKGKVKQILFLEGCGDDKNLGLYTSSHAETDGLMKRKAYNGPLVEELKFWKVTGKDNSEDVDLANNKAESGDTQRDKRKSRDLDRGPNISLNLHRKQKISELGIAAILGIILQSGVIIFSGFVAYDDRFGNMVGGSPSPYAFPVLTAGTVILTLGMWLCAFVIGQSTDEFVWEMIPWSEKDIEKNAIKVTPEKIKTGFIVLWLQKKVVVSDQSFDSYILMAKDKEAILTSRRRDNSALNGYKPNTASEASTAQSLRSSQSRPTERSSLLPWLNILCLFGTFSGIVGFILQFEGFRGISWACSIAQLVATLIMTVVRALVRRGMLDKPIAVRIPPEYDEMDWLALRIGYNDNYLNKLSTLDVQSESRPCSVCGTVDKHACTPPFWKVCNEINPPPEENIGWKVQNVEGDSKAQDVVNIRTRLRVLTTDDWSDPTIKVYAASVATAIEKVMGIFQEWQGSAFSWLIDVHVNNSPTCATAKVKLVANNLEGNSWKVSVLQIESIISLWLNNVRNHQNIRSFQRVIGPFDSNLKKNLTWWAGFGDIGVLDPFNWDDEPGDTLSLGLSPKFSPLYAMTADGPIEKFLAQHIFSTFMWAIAGSLPTVSRRSRYEFKTEVTFPDLEAHTPDWKSLRLTNNKIKQMIKAVELNGLGSLEDSNLLIIPPLSYFDKLPNEDILDEVEKNIPKDELLQLERSCDTYKKLLDLCIGLTFNTIFVHKAVSTTVSFLVTATSAAVAEEYMSNKYKEVLKESKQDLIKILKDNYRHCLIVLKQLYTEQGRPKSFKDAFLLDNDGADDLPLTEQKRLTIEAEMGHTSLHRKIIANENFEIDGELEKLLYVPDILGWTPLHYAVIYSPKNASKLSKEYPDLVNKIDLAGRTPLHYAVMKYKTNKEQENINETIPGLLKVNPELLKGKDGLVPLHWAVKTSNFEATKLLLNTQLHGNTINSKDCWNMTPLHFAALGGHLEIMVHLLDTRPPGYTAPALDSKDLFDRTVLHVAVIGIESSEYLNGADVVKKLIQKGANIQMKDRDGNKALHLAAEMEARFKSERDGAVGKCSATADRAGRTENIAVESERTNSQDGVGKKAFGPIMTSKDDQLRLSIESLLEREDLTVDGGSLLLWAVKNNFQTPFCVLIDSDTAMKGDIKFDTKTGRSILHLAAHAKSDIMVDKILKRWAPRDAESQTNKSDRLPQAALHIDLRDTTGDTALMLASREGHEAIVERLLKANPDKNIKDEFGKTALILAASQGFETIVQRLLHAEADHAEADKDIKDNAERIALSYAVEGGYLNIVTQLLDHHANPDVVDGIPEKSILARAAEMGHSDIAKLLMDRGATLELKGRNDDKTMFIAVKNGNYDIVRLFLKNRADPNEFNAEGHSILSYAIVLGHAKIVELLIDQKAEIEKQSGDYKQTPLSWAAKKGSSEIIELLLTRGAELEAKDTDGWTPLIWALKFEKPGAVKLLLGRGAVKNLLGNGRTGQLESAMIWACKEGDVEIVDLLLDLGTNINAQDSSKKLTPLIEASRNGHEGIVQILLDNKANVNAQNLSKSTALLEAIGQGPENLKEIVKKLLSANADINLANNMGETPLLLAVRIPNENMAKLLVKAKADVNLANDKKETPLLLAVRNQNEDMAKLLVEAKADVNLANDKKETPLLLAVQNQNEDMAKLLVEAKADVNLANYMKETPLLLAVRNKSENIVKLLLKADANVNLTNDEMETPLALAVHLKDEKLVDILTKARAYPDTEDRDKKKPLFFAVYYEVPKIVELLLEAGASINFEEKDEITPLFQAVYAENLEIVRILLKKGADVEKGPIYGRTPLQEAVRWNTKEILEILLSYDAKIHKKDAQGRNALHISAEYGRISMLKMLVQKGCREQPSFDVFGESLRDTQGRDVFHHAPASESVDMISYLLELSPKKDHHRRGDNDGWTPLHWAAQAGDVKVVEELIAAGASSDAKIKECIKQWTPRQIASYNGHGEIVDLLEQISIPNEDLPEAGMIDWGVGCDGCYCYVRGIRYRCKSCEDFDFCEKCKHSSDETHPGHEFQEFGPEKDDSSSDEDSTQQEDVTHKEAIQEITTDDNATTYEDSIQKDTAHENVTQENTTHEETSPEIISNSDITHEESTHGDTTENPVQEDTTPGDISVDADDSPNKDVEGPVTEGVVDFISVNRLISTPVI
ncbi:hypothetical protein NHQ30_009436 [Ciborinia camelliae]|nr:hypothetical protein NHQ30_009436 [Ciborinia camelliae]